MAELAYRLAKSLEVGRSLGGRATSEFVSEQLLAFDGLATDSAYERSFYRRDVAPLPGAVHAVFRTIPELVVRPQSAGQVAQIISDARREGVAVTVRAGASTSLAACVPLRGGVVVDAASLRGVLSVDREAKTARVLAGTVWTELERRLEREGLAPLSLPSSAPASTVGGWLCTGGYGIGSLQYGPFASQLHSIEVVLPGGGIRRLTPDSQPPLGWLAGSEGTLGVVTELEFGVRELRPMRHVLLSCPDMNVVQQLIRVMLQARRVPYAIHFDDRHVMRALDVLGYAPSKWDGGHLVRIDWEEPTDSDAAGETPLDLVKAVPRAVPMPSEAALAEWRERFRALRVKRGGPSVVGAETLLPLSRLPGYVRDVEELARADHRTLMTYGHLAGRQHMVVMTMYYSDETKAFTYLLDLAFVKKLHDLGASHGGAPYGLGLWNTPHLRPTQSPVSVSELQRRKREIDPWGVMNPGKGVARLRLMNPRLVRTGMETLATVGRISRSLQWVGTQ
jgi:glycolate oxidase